MRRWPLVACLAMPHVGCAAWTWMDAESTAPPHPFPVPGTPLFDWKGTIHCHSHLSHDSRGTKAEIAAACADARLDFLVMTDHQTEVSIAQGTRGMVDDTLWVVGAEVRSNRGTVLAFPLVQPLRRVFDVRALVAEAKAQGALVFLGHAERNEAWGTPGLDGVEIVNLHAGAVAAPTFGMLLAGLFLPVRTVMALSARRLPEVFTAWDTQLLRQHPSTPIGGGDAHANVRVFGPLGGTIGDYREVFLTLSTHVLAERLDETSLLEALRAGRSYVSCDVRGSGTGFDFRAVRGAMVHLPGDTVATSRDLELRVHTPTPGELRLLQDGVIVQRIVGTELARRAPSPGIYRVEVLADGEPWLFSSSILVIAEAPCQPAGDRHPSHQDRSPCARSGPSPHPVLPHSVLPPAPSTHHTTGPSSPWRSRHAPGQRSGRTVNRRCCRRRRPSTTA